jgi:hypothetical protein
MIEQIVTGVFVSIGAIITWNCLLVVYAKHIKKEDDES